MAKRSVLERNLKRERLSRFYFDKRKLLKKEVRNPSLSLQDRFAAAQKLASLPRDGSSVRFRNRCVVSGRGRGLAHKTLGVSRIVLRRLMANGFVPGMKKASW